MTGSISPSVLQSIGHTALVELRNVVPPNCARVVAKLEWQNPTGSMKDRMAIAAISRAEEDGQAIRSWSIPAGARALRSRSCAR